MVDALVLLRVKTDRINEVAQELVDLDGISEVYSVAGHYDLVVVIRARGNDQIASLVTEHILKADGLISSETLHRLSHVLQARPRADVLGGFRRELGSRERGWFSRPRPLPRKTGPGVKSTALFRIPHVTSRIPPPPDYELEHRVPHRRPCHAPRHHQLEVPDRRYGSNLDPIAG